MILEALHRIVNHRESLSRDEARLVMSEVLSGKCTDAQISALLVGLHMKGETVEEIVGFAEAIRAAATPIVIGNHALVDSSGTGREALVDTCGTGGDTAGTFNISTATAFVVAGADVRVAKHGNRSSTPKQDGVSAKCGAADVMEALGVNIQLAPAQIWECLEKIGIAFLFAPSIHSAAKYVAPVRREIRLRTVFNLLGPLTNPAGASAQVVGVYSLDLVEKLAQALSILGAHRAFVVHGLDGLDEITVTGPTRVGEVREGSVHTYEISPAEFGLQVSALEELSGGDAAQNAEIVRSVLAGEKSARRDVVLMNAAAALVAADKAEHLSAAVPIAAKSIDSGWAAQKLAQLVQFTNSISNA